MPLKVRVRVTDAARTLATLPLRHGGLWLPDYDFIRSHARAACLELTRETGSFLETFGFPPSRADLEGFEPVSQLPVAQKSRADALLATISVVERLTIVENMSWLGSVWTRMIPIYPTRTLSDRQVSSGIATRLLLSSEPADLCVQCHKQASFLHDDVCEQRRHIPGKASRNAFRDLLGRHARTMGSTIAVENGADAPGANPLLRGDILLTGAAAPDRAGVVDITFTAVAGSRN